jgi:hypothetical protein
MCLAFWSSISWHYSFITESSINSTNNSINLILLYINMPQSTETPYQSQAQEMVAPTSNQVAVEQPVRLNAKTEPLNGPLFSHPC